MNITSINDITIPIGDFALMTFLAMVFALGFCVFLFISLDLSKRLDRYRLKFGFNHELESKDIRGTPDEIKTRLANNERRFNRRVFKD